MKYTITEDHLEAALTAPWSTTTCILAQCFGGPKTVLCCGASSVLLIDQTTQFIDYRDQSKVAFLVSQFDQIHQNKTLTLNQKRFHILPQLPLTFTTS